MNKAGIIWLALLCTCQALFSQPALSGKVISADDKKPLAAVSIYLSSTSIGVSTDTMGIFSFRNFPAGKFQLVVSHIGYETFTKLVNSNNLPGELTIELKPGSNKLPGIILDPWEPYGWSKWGAFFTEMFIGTSSYAKECDLQNPEVIKFRFSKTNNTLTAVAYTPLIIENRALGYEIQYKLEDFEYDFSKKIVSYNGYPLFKDLSPTHPSKAKRWQDKRRNVYYGSVMHFMRTLFTHTLAEEGYEIRSLALVPNLNKERAKELLQNGGEKIQSKADSSYTIEAGTIKLTTKATDSTAYYKKYLKQPDLVVSNELIKPDSICFVPDGSTLGIFSMDSIEVNYLHKDVPIEYKRIGLQHRFDKIPVSQLSFINRKPVFVMRNGYYYGPYDLKITGFWAWWETLSTLMPYDYLPTN